MLRKMVKKSNLSIYFIFVFLTFIEAFISPTVVRMVTISLTDMDMGYLTYALIFSVVTSIVLIIGKFGKKYFYAKVVNDFKINFKYRVLEVFLKKDLFKRDFTASALEKDVNQIVNTYLEPTLILISSIGFTLISILYALFTNMKIGLLFVIFYSLPAFLSHLGEKKLKDNLEMLQNSNRKLTSYELDFINGYKVIKNYNRQCFFLHKYKNLLKQNSKQYLSFEKNKSLNSLIINTINSFTSIAPILIGAKLAMDNYIKIDEFLAVYLISYNIGFQFGEISYYLNTRKSSKRLLEKFGILLEQEEKNPDDKNFEIYPIVFDKVSFSYDDKKIIDDLSFRIDKGNKIAIIGESGRGKSTVLKLLFGLEKPSLGRITFGGEKLKREEIRKFSTYIMQQSYIFDLDLSENISLNEKADKERLKRALSLTNINHLENRRIDHETVSGGEKQRIEISRALYSKKELILADEIKANLDGKNSRIINDVILHSDFTLVEVMHHYNETDLLNYDYIIDLNENKIIKNQ